MLATQLSRASWAIWVVGTALIVLDWMGVVGPTIGWAGFAGALAGALLSVAARYAHRLSPPLAPEALAHPLAACLPDASILPPDLKLVAQASLTNAQVAQTRKSPAEALARLDAIGRVISVYRRYLDRRGCHPQLQWADLSFHIIEYRSPDAARRAVSELDPEYLAQFTRYATVDAVDPTLGEARGAISFFLLNDCRPPQPLLGYEIRFQDENLLVSVDLSAVQETKTAEEIYAQALLLAREIAHRLTYYRQAPR